RRSRRWIRGSPRVLARLGRTPDAVTIGRSGYTAAHGLGPSSAASSMSTTRTVRATPAVLKRTVLSFYDDQMTHHAAALTYYALMSLFPAVLLALSLLGLLGQYPETYNSIIGYLREVSPASVVDPLDRSLRGALQSKGTAATTLVISVVVAL